MQPKQPLTGVELLTIIEKHLRTIKDAIVLFVTLWIISILLQACVVLSGLKF